MPTMVDPPALPFLRSLARAPDVNVSQIKGNITDKQKQLLVNTFFYFIDSREKSYGADIGQRLKILEMNVWEREGSAPYGEVILEIEVKKGERLLLALRLLLNFCYYFKICATYLEKCTVHVHRTWPNRTCCTSVPNNSWCQSLFSCTISSLVVLGIATGVDGAGLSQSMNLIWHQPAHLFVLPFTYVWYRLTHEIYRGDKLRIIATSISNHGHVRSARCEVRLQFLTHQKLI